MAAPSSPPRAPAAASTPLISFDALDDLLFEYKQQFGITSHAFPSSAFSFLEQFQYIHIACNVKLGLDFQPLREALELYGLLLFLHRETTSDVLLQDNRLRLNVCARDQVRPEIQLLLDATDFDAEGNHAQVEDTVAHATEIWKAVVALFDYDTPQPRLSDHYYRTRWTILELFQVDEAFTTKAASHITLSWAWSQELSDMITTIPSTALRRLQCIAPSTPLPEENASRTRLKFKEINTNLEIKSTDYQEAARYAKSWALASDVVKSLKITISSEWSDVDAASAVALLNKGHVDKLELKVDRAHGLSLAMDILAQVETVTDAKLSLRMTDDWDTLTPLPSPSVSPAKGYLRSLDIHVSETPSMAAFVKAMTTLLKDTMSSATAVIERCSEIQLHPLVNEPHPDDHIELVWLLKTFGSRLKVLHINSYGSSEFFNQETYDSASSAFQIWPLLFACPKLRLLNVQGVEFADLAKLFEDGYAQHLEALQVQWASTKSCVALAKALSDPESKIANTLIEFATRAADDEVLESFAETLEKNQKLRYLRVGFRPRTDPLAIKLNTHHIKFMAPGGAAFANLLATAAAAGDARAAFMRECMDDDVLDTIAQFVGSAVHRQIHSR